MADLTITAANVKLGSNAQTANGTYGETITQGQAVYRKTDDGNKLYKADADAAASAVFAGIALTPGGAGDPAIIVSGGNIVPGATLTQGTTYCVSGTAGGICPIADLTTGDYVSIIGTASSASVLKIQSAVSGVAKP